MSLLEKIDSPSDLQQLSEPELTLLAAEIRECLIDVTSQTGGHLASSLGATDLIVALHSIYHAPDDHIVYDTSHQAYAHKLICGRRDVFAGLRSFGGISGFTRKDESPYDVYDAGHASDALSIALGLVLARDLSHGQERVVVLVGDASISGGMAFEALNQIGHEGRDITIILNDNEMSIAHNVGALSLYLAKVRASRPYLWTRDTVEGRLSKMGPPGRFLVNTGNRFKASAKKLLLGSTLFEDMGITYLGPVDGHSIPRLRAVLVAAERISGPVLVHAITQKGHGYPPAAANPEGFHGAGRFDRQTGVFEPPVAQGPTYTQCFAQALVNAAEQNPDIVAITAAMPNGTGLDEFERRFTGRFFDVGIAEEHGVTLSAGLALRGKLPVVAIYSTFLQRAFDQVLTNVCLMNLHVVLCLDRAGVVGEDGTTHHGMFDIAYLRMIPNMRIIAPADAQQLADALYTALAMDGPVALRYPRGEAAAPGVATYGSVAGQPTADDQVGSSSHMGDLGAAQLTRRYDTIDQCHPKMLKPGKSVQLRQGSDVAVLALGSMVSPSLAAADKLAAEGISVAVHNMLWVKPLDRDLLSTLAGFPLVVTVEEGTLCGGFGSAVLECLAELAASETESKELGKNTVDIPDGSLAASHPSSGGSPDAPPPGGQPDGSLRRPRIVRIGVPDEFVTHGAPRVLHSELGLDAEHLAQRISDAFVGADQA
ncbi:MAG: 1-deoxy-D-xylulose-5-phosphate synthase [Actinomycetia bacterium]|nr:1-deoxy-D-xylulose-5-phosphate synthase [Actinomycetes bacterium]